MISFLLQKVSGVFSNSESSGAKGVLSRAKALVESPGVNESGKLVGTTERRPIDKDLGTDVRPERSIISASRTRSLVTSIPAKGTPLLLNKASAFRL